MTLIGLFYHIFLCLSVMAVSSPTLSLDANTDTATVITALSGSSAFLPCFTNSSEEDGDRVNLVLWFRDQELAPFYTYDNVDLSVQPKHWKDPKLPSSLRQHFLVAQKLSGLKIENINLEDEGKYRCRVDFEHQQTVIWWIELIVIVPPDKPRIAQPKNAKIKQGEIDIRNENMTISLKCEVSGGVPLPFVSWWKDEVLIDSSCERHGDSIINEVILNQISRDDQNSILTCRATNNNISEPISSSVKITVRVLPTLVEIIEPDLDIRESHSVTFECLIKEANPKPKIIWLKDGVAYSQSLQYDSDDNTVVSAIFLTLGREDNGKELSCRAEVSGLLGHRQSSLKLEVKYTPTAVIKLGSPLKIERIEEGHDVYFDCKVDANPPASSIQWLHNKKTIQPSKDSHILDSDNILAIQSVRISHSGNYSCTAENELGIVDSDDITIDVKYPPKCLPGQQAEYETSLFQPLSIFCSVVANPGKNLTFHWVFNSSEVEYEQKGLTSDGSSYTSEILFTPSNMENLGNISCYVSNIIGHQVLPCIFRIIPMLPPPPPTNCLVMNITHSDFSVFCKTSKDINTSMFSIIVSVSATGEETFFAKSSIPFFLITELLPSTCYTVKVWASNSHGNSDPNYITMTTLNVPDIAERKLKNNDQDKSMIWLSVFIGLTVLVILFVITVMSLKFCRNEGLVTSDSDGHTMYHEIDNSRAEGLLEVETASHGRYHQIDDVKPNEQSTVISAEGPLMEGFEQMIAHSSIYRNAGGATKKNQFEQGSVLEGLESCKPQFSPKNLYRHSVSNPTFYIAERKFKLERNFSENCSENIEVIQEQELNKRFSDTRAYTSGTDNRNKLLRESFI